VRDGVGLEPKTHPGNTLHTVFTLETEALVADDKLEDAWVDAQRPHVARGHPGAESKWFFKQLITCCGHVCLEVINAAAARKAASSDLDDNILADVVAIATELRPFVRGRLVKHKGLDNDAIDEEKGRKTTKVPKSIAAKAPKKVTSKAPTVSTPRDLGKKKIQELANLVVVVVVVHITRSCQLVCSQMAGDLGGSL